MHRVSSVIVSLCLVGGLCACSGPSETAGQSGPSAESDPAPTADREAVAEYETFDPSDYPLKRSPTVKGVTHDVPDRLLRGRADEGVQQTTEGYRIQVFSAQQQDASEEVREEVRQWWETAEEEAPQDVFGDSPPVVVEYSQPYYRVRFGAFTDRETAEEALDFVQQEYPSAFVARGTVTVVR